MSRLIITNQAYLSKPDQYRAAGKLTQRLLAPDTVACGVDFRSRGLPVPEAVTCQLREKMCAILAADRVEVYMGDGGIALALNALHELQIECRELAEKTIGIAPGGTMNNLHASLRVAGNVSPQTAKPTKIREFTWSHGDQTETCPVVSFFGIGVDAEFLHHYEQRSRRNRPEFNIAAAAVDMATNFWRERNLPQTSHAVLAIPRWGGMKFPDEFYRLSEDSMALMNLSAGNGFEAAGLFALYQIAGQSPAFLEWLWERKGLRHAIAREVSSLDWFVTRAQDMKPKFIQAEEFDVKVNGHGFIFHTDGTAHSRMIPWGSTVHCGISTKSGPSVPIYAV